MSRYDLIIFDCDGVLVDSERIAVRLEAASLTARGWNVTEADIVENFLGRSDEHILAEVASRIGHDAATEWAKANRAEYDIALATTLTPVDGIAEALDRIGTPICVTSSSKLEHIRLVLGVVGLLPRFDGRMFSATQVEHGKPAPDLFLLAASTYGAAPARCAVVEDSPVGVAAGLAAGMAVFGYAGGLTGASTLRSPGVIVFTDMRELPRLLEGQDPDGR